MTARELHAADDGAAALEFALVAPVFLLMLLGVFDLGYNMYTDTLLQGAIQKAARDSSIEGAPGHANALDNRVRDVVENIAPHATLSFQRTAYSSFNDVRQPETYADNNHDGTCNNNEVFEDANGNGNWDADRGTAGFGGARDAVLYKVTVDYPRPFPIARLVGQSNTFTLTAQTVLRNQPFDAQMTNSGTGNCT